MQERSETDRDAVTRLLGREPAGRFAVAVRRPTGAPAVIENEVFLEDGTPMPTRYWLVDQAWREEVSRLEAGGGVRRAAAEVSPEAVAAAHARYAAERDALVSPAHAGPVPTGGVGGTRVGVKCLHAHLAWYLAGGDDPVGRWTAEELAIGPADFVCEGSGQLDTVAAVDCGTNSTRLIVADARGAVLEREMRITRLGEGVDATRRLAPDAIVRTLSVLRGYRATMDRHGVSRRRIVATSAARDAGNADEFMREATAIVGAAPDVLSGEEEGRLSFLGATAHLPEDLNKDAGPVLVVDIGGGSTELSVGTPASTTGTPQPAVTSVSLDLGCVRVSERYFAHDPPAPGEVAQALADVEASVTSARSGLPHLPAGGVAVGLAGTVSTVASLERNVAVYERTLLHHAEFPRAAVERWLRILAAEKTAARLERPGMSAGREDVIVGGVVILAVVMKVFEASRCLYSEDDILDGMVIDMLREDRTDT